MEKNFKPILRLRIIRREKYFIFEKKKKKNKG